MAKKIKISSEDFQVKLGSKVYLNKWPTRVDALNELKMAYPKATTKRRKELKSIRKQL